MNRPISVQRAADANGIGKTLAGSVPSIFAEPTHDAGSVPRCLAYDRKVDRRRPLLVNIGESETDAVLREVAAKLGVRVVMKPRMADVLNIDRSGLSNDEYRYALQAHLDFVVCSDDTEARAHFAVEFDGPYHASDEAAKRRDAMKDAICERLGLPLLRIDADFLRTVKGFRIVAWLIELWYLAEAFYEAQENGSIPWDEPFIPYSVVTQDDSGMLTFSYDLASEATRTIFTARREGRCCQSFPDHFFRSGDGFGEAHAVLALPGDRWLTSYVRVRDFRFASVSPGELASDLAVVDIATKVEEFERGVGVQLGASSVMKSCGWWAAMWSTASGLSTVWVRGDGRAAGRRAAAGSGRSSAS